MNKKVVLVVDDDNHRAEKLLFILRLGGYETRTFGNAATVFNWVKYGCSADEVLCILFNHPDGLQQAGEIFATWAGIGMIVPVVLLQREKGNWSQLLGIGETDLFFVCAPESVMQTLDILSVIASADGNAGHKREMPSSNKAKMVAH